MRVNKAGITNYCPEGPLSTQDEARFEQCACRCDKTFVTLKPMTPECTTRPRIKLRAKSQHDGLSKP